MKPKAFTESAHQSTTPNPLFYWLLWGQSDIPEGS